MRKFLSSLALLLVPLPILQAQSGDALKTTLLHRGDDFMAAWKAHDSAALSALLTPDFTYVGPGGVIAGADNTAKNITACQITSYSVTEPRVISISPTAAILITRQQQQISCAGHPLPPVMLMTDTYVLRGGKWLLLAHTEAPPEAH